MPAGRVRRLSAAAVCVVLAGGVGGCSQRSADTESPPAADQTAAAPAPEPPAGNPGKLPTLADYIRRGNITETPIMPGDPNAANAPVIKLPALPGWKDLGAAKPPGAWGAIIDGDPAFAADPPSIVVYYSRLQGADPAEVLKLAPNELRNLPGFKGADAAPSMLAGFDAVEASGSYIRDGSTRMIGQKTVVIPSDDALYVLQINADGLRTQAAQLILATELINREAVITPAAATP